MNVCFYTSNEVSPTLGGTERITCSIATGLTKYHGIHCFSIYTNSLQSGFDPYVFEAKMHIRGRGKQFSNEVEGFVHRHHIDVMINQGDFGRTKTFARIMHAQLGGCSLFVHHFKPGWEFHFISLKGSIHAFAKHRNIRTLSKLICYPLLKLRHILFLPRNYRTAYEVSDKVILLSDGFRPEYKRLAGITEETKFATIPNCLSFDTSLISDCLKQKEKIVLIVSRLEEKQKRILTALKIWEKIEQEPELAKWKLKIVGHGPDAIRYKRYVKQHALHRVTFEGMKSPGTYYERASLFMLTSRSEGWGLTLTEAQQYGCVPIAFDSYASLHDIICHNSNGCIITNNDIDGYAQCMKHLMLHNEERITMAQQAIESTHRFEMKVVANQWISLLNKTNKL